VARSIVVVTCATAIILLAGACSNPVGPGYEWRTQPGYIGAEAERVLLNVPDVVDGTGARDVVVQTFGSSSCTRAAGAGVEYTNLVVTISPIDSVAIRGICTADLAAHPRDVGIDFSTVGTWTVRVVGRGVDNGAVHEIQVLVRESP